MAQAELNTIDGIKLALERHQFADIMTASAEIQSRLVLTVPLTEPDCALPAAALFARAAAHVYYREYNEGRQAADIGSCWSKNVMVNLSLLFRPSAPEFEISQSRGNYFNLQGGRAPSK